ncbi:hypothetical protein HMPREF1576_00724, partial [Gardnerella pickettii JCP7719]
CSLDRSDIHPLRQSQIRKTQMQKETQLFNCKTTLEYIRRMAR